MSFAFCTSWTRRSSIHSISGTGFAGRVFRLRPQYEGDAGDAPRSMIAKLPSIDATTRALINEIRGYELESIFYRELAERTPTPVPQCFWNAADTDAGDYMLILEDLEGYSMGGQTADEVDVDLVTALVREAARLHTTWWNDDASLARASLPDAEGPELRAWMRVAREGLPIWERTRGGQYPRKVVTKIMAAMSDIERLAATAAEGATTLVHGDYRLDNVMYAPNNLERPPVVLDWQLVRRGSGAYDLAYLLSQSVPTEQRRRHEEAWLALYLEELDQPGYGEDRLRRDFAIGLLQALAIPVAAASATAQAKELMVDMPPGSVLDGYETVVSAMEHLTSLRSDRCVATIIDHDALRVLDSRSRSLGR